MFDEHLKTVSLKLSKTLGLLRKLQNLLPMCTAFFRPYLDYGDTLYDQPYMSFHHKLEIYSV